MYIPAHFAVDPAAVDELLAKHGAADLITLTDDGLLATMLPFAYEPSAGEHGAQWGASVRARAPKKRPVAQAGPRRVAGHRPRPRFLCVPVLVRGQGRTRPGRPHLELPHGPRLRPAPGS